MSAKLQIPHSLNRISDSVAVHLADFQRETHDDLRVDWRKEGSGIEYFNLRIARFMFTPTDRNADDLGYIRLRRLDTSLTELILEDSHQLEIGPDAFLTAHIRFWDDDGDEFEGREQVSRVERKPIAAKKFERFRFLHEGARQAVIQGLKDDRLLLAEKKFTTSSVAQAAYINKSRLVELRQIRSTDFDLRRLILLCDELNKCFASSSFCATTYLVRAILDHVPPIFGVRTFSEVANNIGSKSTKASLLHLERSSRNIADSLLHQQIRQREVVPTATQVDFKNDLDVLLGEIVRRLG